MAAQNDLPEVQLDLKALYREDVFTDRRAGSGRRRAGRRARERRRQDQVSLVKTLRWRAAVAAVMGLCAACLLVACARAQLGGREPVPGSGPGGKPMRTATETAVGMPPAAPT